MEKRFKSGAYTVTAKKNLGQHFLKDQNIARKIVGALSPLQNGQILEIGPGMGILTRFLLELPGIDLKVIEIDQESVDYLELNFPLIKSSLIHADFLTTDLTRLFTGEFSVIGNFPYHISSQIFFRILAHRERIPQVVGMVQKEVAERICHGPGSRTYGILSVLLQAFYDIEYLFTVGESVFVPPPKVKSAVIRLNRHGRGYPGCEDEFFFSVVKTAFNQRRKILGNALKPLSEKIPEEYAGKRAEQLSPEQFARLTLLIKNRQET
jgi:16S rRNA (adenine1518-N6/adenine1519-N6)-dimethyltransferase